MCSTCSLLGSASAAVCLCVQALVHAAQADRSGAVRKAYAAAAAQLAACAPEARTAKLADSIVELSKSGGEGVSYHMHSSELGSRTSAYQLSERSSAWLPNRYAWLHLDQLRSRSFADCWLTQPSAESLPSMQLTTQAVQPQV